MIMLIIIVMPVISDDYDSNNDTMISYTGGLGPDLRVGGPAQPRPGLTVTDGNFVAPFAAEA